ncbi:CoA transferase, partial [Planomonospora algeriensis]
PTAAAQPLVETRLTGGSGPRALPPAPLPAGGVRVLDLTRVIAGPVATRTLALLGADVLRVDPPGIPEDADSHADTGMGKRSALLDLSVPADRRAFDDLLGSADVVVTGYRPGSLDRYGLAPEALLARRPGLILAQLCAWGWSGSWAGRRGFDSLVQAASGIAVIESAAGGRPGALPAQALDHATGYLLAAAVLRALSDRHLTGGGRLSRLSLAGTASWLLHGIRPVPAAEAGLRPAALAGRDRLAVRSAPPRPASGGLRRRAQDVGAPTGPVGKRPSRLGRAPARDRLTGRDPPTAAG